MNIRNTNVKSSKGITLISLIITIIVLIILASISVYSGISTIRNSRFIEFRLELEIMQTQVDYLNEEYTRLEKNGEDGESYIQSKGKDLTYSAEEQESFEGAGISDKTNYRYFDKTSIEDLGLSGLKYEFLLSIKDRKVIAIGGLKYNGIIYYTIDQIREVLELEPLERGPVTVDNIDFNPIEGTRCKIVVTNIKCSKYVAKYTIQYRNVDLGDTFSTVGKLITDKDVSFEVDTEGTYEILITDAAGQTLLQTISIQRNTITYDANGGIGAPEKGFAYSGKSFTISTVEPTRDEYVFKGWSTSRNGNIDYKPGETVVFNADTRLYAVWGKIKKALIAMTSVTGFNVEHWHNVIVPHMKEYFNDAYPEIKITTVTGNEARQTLQELVVNNYDYEIVILQNAVWEVPEIANELAKKYNLLTIGNDSGDSQKLDIAKSLGKRMQATEISPSPVNIREDLKLTSYGQNVLGNGVPPPRTDQSIIRTEFIDEAKTLATATYDSPESNEIYVGGVKSTEYPIKDVPVIVEWRNKETGKAWIHCQYGIGQNDQVEEYDLMVRLIKLIFGDV